MVGHVGVISFAMNFKKIFDKTKIEHHVIQTSDLLLESQLDPLSERMADISVLVKYLESIY